MICRDRSSNESNDIDAFCHTSQDAYNFTSPVALASQVFAIGVLVVLCLFGNGLMIYAVVKTRRGAILSASSLLLINLATADLLVGIFVLPMWMVSTASLSWPMPEFLCTTTAFFTVTLMVCSILSLSAIAVDRYLNLAYPLRYPTEVTPVRLVIVLVSIWTFCFLVAGLPLCGWGQYRFQPQTVPICNPVWVTEVGFAIFLMLCGLTLPFVVMLVAYVRIVQIAKHHIAKIEATQVCLVGTLAAATEKRNEPSENTGGRRSVGLHDSINVEAVCDVSEDTSSAEESRQPEFKSGKDQNQNQTVTAQPTLESKSSDSVTSHVERSSGLPRLVLHRPSNGTVSLSPSLHPSPPPKKNSTSSVRLGLTSRVSGISLRRTFSKSIRTANRVFIAVGVFFLCWGPYVILNFWSVNNDHLPVPYSADLLTTLLAFANSCINPVLFLVINKDFRRQVRMLGRKWTPCFHRKHEHPSRMGSVWYLGDSGCNGVSVIHSEVEMDDGKYHRRTDMSTGREGASVVREAW